ncbi:P-loop ATPase, Sll1717 family [Ensifer adhaerens]
MTGHKSLSELNSFGDVAAEDDAVLDYFLSTNAVESIEGGKAFLVLGRKGTGKTALVRYFSEGKASGTSRPLSLRGYPWGIHAQRVDRGASEIEAYVSSWRYLIAVELASLLLTLPGSSRTHKSEVLSKFLEENYGGPNPDLSKILQPKRISVSKLTLMPAILGNQLGGVELERKQGDHNFGLELNALSQSIMNAVIDAAKDMNVQSLSLHFDELDQGLDRLNDERRRMLIGLVLAAREVRRESASEGLAINPVVYLRSDLWDEMNFSDKNKISQSLTLHLNWKSDELLSLINARLRAKLGTGATWDSVSAPDLMRGSQTKWNHVLARTFNRPRDVIQFLNIALAEAKRRDEINTVIRNEDIVASRDAYSAYLKSELDDEVGPHWPQWIEALGACSNISTLTFEREQFKVQYTKRKTSGNPVDGDTALELMHRFSVVGYETRSGYGGSAWSFRYSDPSAGWDNSASRFKVHLGLKEYAKLREVRLASS